jgi:hypothetical protein
MPPTVDALVGNQQQQQQQASDECRVFERIVLCTILEKSHAVQMLNLA